MTGPTDTTVADRCLTVVVDRRGEQSGDYEVIGFSRCVHCSHVVLAGRRTWLLIATGQALPLCLPCARQLHRDDPTLLGEPVSRALDAEQPDDSRFCCPRCGARSAHPTDIAEGYCGACHQFTGEPRAWGGEPR